MTLWVPAYGLEAIVKAATAVISIGTALVLWKVLPQILAQPSLSELRRANAALQESEARYRASFERSPTPMCVYRVDGTIANVSESWLDLFGYARKDVVGRRISEFWAAGMGPWENADLTRLMAERRIANLERQFQRRDGGTVDVLLSARLEHRDGDTLIIAGLTDVTARKLAEGALRAAEERLHQSQKMEAIGQLTGGIAHDFNNMLQGVIGGVELMERAIADDDARRAARYVSIVRKSADRAANLTNRMLAFARRQTLQPLPVEPDALVRGIQELIQRTVGPEVEVRTRLHDGVWAVKCDPNQLESALLNLAINARDAMPDGGALTISTTDVTLTAVDLADQDEATPGEYVAIELADTGTGMTPDVFARAFEPFFTTKPTGQGTGLGLSQVFGFVRQSGGFVRLRSKPAAGTRVCIYLPRDKKIQVTGIQTDDPPDTFAAIAPDPIEGKTVLVVEDEADVRTMMVDVLRDLGCCILEAGTGTAGLKLVQSGSQVDLLVTDVGLPGLNGRQLADAARERNPDLPVLLVTGYAGRALDEAAPAPGMEILRKPFVVDALVSRITALLRWNIQLPSVGTDS